MVLLLQNWIKIFIVVKYMSNKTKILCIVGRVPTENIQLIDQQQNFKIN